MIAPTPIIRPRKNGNVQRVIDLHGKGMSPGRIAARLEIQERTVRAYIKQYCNTDASVYHGDEPRCRCSLRLSTPDELAAGRCSNCLPDSATAFLGRSGEPAACSSGLRVFGGGA